MVREYGKDNRRSDNMKECIFEIISNTKLADNTYEMVFAAPEGEHGVTNPGQFVNIRIEMVCPLNPSI